MGAGYTVRVGAVGDRQDAINGLRLRLGQSPADVLVECAAHREAGVCETVAGVSSGKIEGQRCLTERDTIDVGEGQQAPVDRVELAEGGIDHAEQFSGQNVVGLQDPVTVPRLPVDRSTRPGRALTVEIGVEQFGFVSIRIDAERWCWWALQCRLASTGEASERRSQSGVAGVGRPVGERSADRCLDEIVRGSRVQRDRQGVQLRQVARQVGNELLQHVGDIKPGPVGKDGDRSAQLVQERTEGEPAAASRHLRRARLGRSCDARVTSLARNTWETLSMTSPDEAD